MRVLLFTFLFAASLSAGESAGNRFVFGVLKHGGAWDPYGDLWDDISLDLERMTSLRPVRERRVLSLDDPALFETPFLAVSGRDAFSPTEEELSRLRRHLSSGGFLFFDDSAADRAGPFARSVDSLPARLFPGSVWREVPADHAVFRSFFLVRGAAGRRAVSGLKGLWVQDRLAAVYSPNDLHGAWVRSPAGGYLLPCLPGGEPQRWEARKLLANIVLFSLTGTYKTDAIHQEYLKRKLEP